MKFVFALIFQYLLMSSALFGTIDVQTITVTTPVLHTWDKGEVKFAKIPYTGWDIDNLFYHSEYYSMPYHVLETKKHLRQDINLISVFKLRVQSNHDNGLTTIYISTANTEKPEGHRFTVDEVVKYTMEAIRSDFPDKDQYAIEVTEKSIEELFAFLRKAKQADQGGADQPATAPEGKDKPELNSEGRSD